MTTISRNRREGRYRGRQHGMHWRSLSGWLNMVRWSTRRHRRAPAGILTLTHAYLRTALEAITAIADNDANEAALEVVRYAMDVVPDEPDCPLGAELVRVAILIEAWERANVIFPSWFASNASHKSCSSPTLIRSTI